jgi:predicted amidophosphoribosyltransferase
MKFQIECSTSKSRQLCLICKQNFKINEARLIVCNDEGDRYGDVCHQCIAKGGNWVQFQLQEFSNKLLARKTEVGV